MIGMRCRLVQDDHMRASLLWAVVAVPVILAPSLGSAQAIRCNKRVVSVGDTAYELTARCGAPDHRTVVRDFRAVTVTGPDGNAVRQAVEEDVEVLTYSGRKGDLPRIVTVRRGVIRSIRTSDRVLSTGANGCTPEIFPKKVTSGEVRLACGRPVDQSRWTEDRAIRVRGQIFRRAIQVEQWVYDPGPGRLLRILRFENGELVASSTGRRSPSK